MDENKNIFGLRFGSSTEISPSQEEMDAFLRSPKKSGRKERHWHDTASYGELMQRIRALEQRERRETNVRERMFYFALGHSRFVNPALKSAVEHFKYQLHEFATLNFKKPRAFIATAEAEMDRLNPKKKEDAAKLERLWSMVEERKKALTVLARRRDALSGELTNIARYIGENLVKVETICETAIVVLVNVEIGLTEEGRLIRDMRQQLKEERRDYQSDSQLSGARLEDLKNEIDELSKEISRIFREDVYALAALYEAIYEHARKTALEIDALLAQAKQKKVRDGLDETEVYRRLEGVFVSLLSDFRFEPKLIAIPSDSSRAELLRKKRTEMLSRLFELLQQERRKRIDRRRSADRRTYHDTGYSGPEQRSGNERRSVKGRRKT